MMHSLLGMAHADPWAKDFIDLPSLNSGATKAIENEIKDIERTAKEAPSTLHGRSLAILGPAGVGKTHLFLRLRRRVGPRAIFVHVRPLIGADMTPRYLLRQIVEQLAYESEGFRQIDALVGAIAAYAQGGPIRLPRAFVQELLTLPEQERAERLEQIIDHVLRLWPQADEIYLRRLLALPFAPPLMQRALFAWLAGRELDDTQMARLHVRDGLSDDLIMPALRTLGAVAAPGSPIVTVFDQLENLIDDGQTGRVRAYGNLIAELVDEVRGVVVVQMALDSEWSRAIEPAFATSQRTRAAMRREHLALPSPQQRKELLALWATNMPEFREQSLESFGEARINHWCTQPGMTPRMLLLACVRALDGHCDESVGSMQPATQDKLVHEEELHQAIHKAWQSELVRARGAIDDAWNSGRCVDVELVADGLGLAIDVSEALKLRSVGLGRPAQIVAASGARDVHIALVTKNHPKSVASVIDALIQLAEAGPVIAFRDRANDFPPTWKICLQKCQHFVAMPNARWCDLEKEDLARILALRSMIANAKSGDVVDHEGRPLEHATVHAWTRSALDVDTWPMVRAISEQQATSPDEVSCRPKPASGLVQAPPSSPLVPPVVASDACCGIAIPTLRRLRVASLDRLVREVARLHPASTLATVVAELERVGTRVRWFGRTIVSAREDEE